MIGRVEVGQVWAALDTRCVSAGHNQARKVVRLETVPYGSTWGMRASGLANVGKEFVYAVLGPDAHREHGVTTRVQVRERDGMQTINGYRMIEDTPA